MILTQPKITFKQADFFTKWLSYGPLIAKKSPVLNSMWRGPEIDHAHFRMTRTGEFYLEKLNFRLHNRGDRGH